MNTFRLWRLDLAASLLRRQRIIRQSSIVVTPGASPYDANVKPKLAQKCREFGGSIDRGAYVL